MSVKKMASQYLSTGTKLGLSACLVPENPRRHRLLPLRTVVLCCRLLLGCVVALCCRLTLESRLVLNLWSSYLSLQSAVQLSFVQL